ncbi:glucuronate isomerase [Flavihumibacter profundi]|uniref:glucuronate isomerase n=1 Tax=Flavihumibacter profundi TaxID=2716883 RepID=UPI001CC4C34D|nr:glucuronate isomerase [Flavihumibacter profundi]MBZ5855988.1 glucuronate isomerase [Flavihumibacter profundi]
MTENFLLYNATAIRLYNEYASKMPIIDYHNHLPVNQIAGDIQFENITQAWLYGDHYKWRAMRTNGVPEKYCTGDTSDRDKFKAWAETVPYTLRNPLYHWTHLELQRYFGVNEFLSPANAMQVFDSCSHQLQTPAFSVKNLLRKMNVRLLCTTDDPVDSLNFHQKLKADQFDIPVLPGFRPDKAIEITNPEIFNAYLSQLESASGISINRFSDYLDAIKQRHDFFAANGCVVADHGLEEIYAVDFTEREVSKSFNKVRNGLKVSPIEYQQFKLAMLLQLAEWHHEKGWTQQFHLGAIRNNNSRMLAKLGPDTGWDSIGDARHAKPLAAFLDRLDKTNHLTKTILYNLNPADNEVFATMTGNFNDGSIAGKIQWGAAWWFLDQKDGIKRHLDALSNASLVSRFVGMLTDSRSFLSFPRHEYFRRILCNTFGEEMEKGELPNDLTWIGQVIENICYNNTREFLFTRREIPGG